MSACLALAFLSSSVACSRTRHEPPPNAANIVLVVADSLRADRLGCYGTRRKTSPALDRLASEGVLFERAYSTSSWTQPSVASILSGRFPSAHGLQQIGHLLDESLPTLPSLFSERGFSTGAVVSHLLLGQRFGFARGFEKFDETEARGHAHVSTPGVTERATEMLQSFASAGRPFLLFVHYFDPHYSYVDHPGIRFANPGEGRVRGGETINEVAGLLPSMSKQELQTLRALYDEEVRATDAGVEGLVAAIDDLGLAEDTVFVFTADHGEEFVDHGFIGHTYTLYEEIVRVPLIVRLPARLRGERAAGPVRIPQPVSLSGLAPWLLELAGLDPERLDAQSHSLGEQLALGLAAGEDRTPILSEVDYIEWKPAVGNALPTADSRTRKRSLVQGQWKVIHDRTSGKLELFDLAADPHELHDLAQARPEQSAAMAEALEREVARVTGADAGEGELVDIAPDEAAALRALGYATP